MTSSFCGTETLPQSLGGKITEVSGVFTTVMNDYCICMKEEEEKECSSSSSPEKQEQRQELNDFFQLFEN